MRIAFGLDLGTTSISAVAVGDDGQLIGRVTRSHHADIAGLPSGHAEQSPHAILEVALEILKELAASQPQPPVCLGLTGQMHGVVIIDKDLTPLTNLITWQDKRAAEPNGLGESWLEAFRARCDEESIRRTGCTPSPGYLAVTLFALMQQGALPEQMEHATVVADWVAAKLTNTVPVTDRTNAASTGAYDLERDQWSEILTAARLPPILFPNVVESGSVIGGLTPGFAARTGLPSGLPVSCAVGDHQAAVLGSLPAEESAIHVNVGTGGQVSLPIKRFLRTATSDTRYLPEGRYLLVGAGLAGGDAYAWVRRTASQWLHAFGAELTDEALFDVLNRLATAVPPGCDGLRAEPFFRGTRREPDRRGLFSGVSTDNFSPGHIARSVLEGIAAALAGFVEAHATLPEVAASFTRVIATGNGVRRNPLLASSLARVFRLPVFTPEHEEEAAYGAAVLAGVKAGLWSDLADVGTRFRLNQAASPTDTQ